MCSLAHHSLIWVARSGMDHGLSNKLSYVTVISDVQFKCRFGTFSFDNISQTELYPEEKMFMKSNISQLYLIFDLVFPLTR